jgi:hypothetical protein
VTEEPAERIVVIWSPAARTDLRAIDRDRAMEILYCVNRPPIFPLDNLWEVRHTIP